MMSRDDPGPPDESPESERFPNEPFTPPMPAPPSPIRERRLACEELMAFILATHPA